MNYVILEKSRVKAHVRTRKGTMERVKEHERVGEPEKDWDGKGKHPYFGMFKLGKIRGLGLGVSTQFVGPKGHLADVYYDSAYVGVGRGTKQMVIVRFKNKNNMNDMGYIPSYFEKTFWEKDASFDRERVAKWLNNNGLQEIFWKW